MAQLATTVTTSEDVHFEPARTAWRRAAARAFGSWLACIVAYAISSI